MGDKYILFSGNLNPLTPMKATDAKIKEISSLGYKQGKDYNIVPLKIALGNKKGGSVIKSKYSKGGGVRSAKYKI